MRRIANICSYTKPFLVPFLDFNVALEITEDHYIGKTEIILVHKLKEHHKNKQISLL
jgi:hypothetical protein